MEQRSMQLNHYSGSTAVRIRNCTKTYKSFLDHTRFRSSNIKPVFHDLNLTVPKEKIYALLGICGSGKTTLLRCILEQIGLDSGSIELLGRDLGSSQAFLDFSIGYMPQETRLFPSLSIDETVHYEGRIIGLSNAFIAYKLKMLVEFLRLPEKTTVINQLSDGELKRLSFIVSVMHEPTLLILDEPTMSMDPMSRQRIRRYLEYMKKTYSTTVIIATQLNEEANAADVIGFLHEGQIAAEGPLLDLMRKWTCASLDDLCISILSKTQKPDSDPRHPAAKPEIVDAILTHHGSYDKELAASNHVYGFKFDAELRVAARVDDYENGHRKMSAHPRLSRTSAVMSTYFLRLMRFRLALAVLFCLPAITVLSALLGVGSKINSLPVGVLNEDTGESGEWLLADLDASIFTRIPVNTVVDGKQALSDGDIEAFIYIGQNFTNNLIERFIDVVHISKDIIWSGFLSVSIDTTNKPVLYSMGLDMIKKMEALWHRVLTVKGYSGKVSDLPVKVLFVPEMLVDEPFTMSIVPFIVVTTMFMSQVGTSMLFLFMKKRKGKFMGLTCLVDDIGNLDMFIGLVVIQMFITIGQAVVIISITFAKFQYLNFSVPLVIVTLMAGVSGMALGIFLKVILESMLAIIITGVIAPMALTCLLGIFHPIEVLPYYFQCFLKGLPIYFPARALAGIMYRGFDFSDSPVTLGLAVSATWIFVFTSLAFICLRKQ